MTLMARRPRVKSTPVDGPTASPVGTASGIDRDTIIASEKLHAVRFPPAAADRLPALMEAQVANVLAVRETRPPRALQPALRFDPRIPGRSYAGQANRIVLKGQ